MSRHSSNNQQPRSRALVPASPPQLPDQVRLRGTALGSPNTLEKPASSRWRRWATIGGAIAGVTAIALVSANLLAPSGLVEGRLASWLKAQTGRDLAINGGTSLSFLPSPHIVMTDVLISGQDGGSATTLNIPKLDITLGLVSLLSGGMSVEAVTLERPVLNIHSGGKSAVVQPVAEGALPVTQPAGQKGLELRLSPALAFGELHIRDGSIRIHSPHRARPRRFDRINTGVKLTDVAEPMIGNGQFNWRGKTLGFRFKLASLSDLEQERAAVLKFSVTGDTMTTRFNGDLSMSPEFVGRGTLTANTPSVRQFLAWLKGVSGAVPVAGEGTLTSAVVWTGDEIALNDLRFEQEDAQGQGQAAIDLTGPRPRLHGSLVVEKLDLAPALAFIGVEPEVTASVSTTAQGAKTTAPAVPLGQTEWFHAPAKPALQIEQAVVAPPGLEAGSPRLLKPGPGISQPSLTISMPQANIDHVLGIDAEGPLSPLFDADLNLDIRSADLGGVKIGSSALRAELNDGVLTATLWRMELYEGEGQGALTVDFNKPVPDFRARLRIQNISAKPFLMDAIGLKTVEGQGKLTLNVAGQGDDARAVAHSLMGNGAFVVTDGALEGIAPQTLAKSLQSGTIDLLTDPAARTPFSVLAGSFDINHGVAETRDLRLKATAASARAEGMVNIALKTLDLLVVPGPVTTERGGGVAAVSDDLTPIHVAGPLHDPHVVPPSDPFAGGIKFPEDASGAARVAGERRRIRRRQQITLKPGSAANAPSFSLAPADGDGSPSLRTQPLR